MGRLGGTARVIVAAVASAAWLGLVAAPAVADQVLTITTDTTLTEDHVGGILFAADNVTLDCAGFAVIGPDAVPDVDTGQSAGILVDGWDGVTIKDCTISGFLQFGVLIRNSAGSTLAGNTAIQNGASGFGLDTTNQAVLTDNVSQQNGEHGFFGDTVTQTSFDGDVASGNAGAGFFLEYAGYIVFDSNEASDNGDDGFSAIEEGAIDFIDNRATDNAWDGFSVFGENNRFLGNRARGNGDAGIFLLLSSNNLISSNHLNENGDGIRFDRGGWNDIVGNHMMRNRRYGINLYGVSSTTITRNVACRNGVLDAIEDPGEGGGGNTWIDNHFCTSSILG